MMFLGIIGTYGYEIQDIRVESALFGFYFGYCVLLCVEFIYKFEAVVCFDSLLTGHYSLALF